MAEKQSYQDFLAKHNAAQKKMQELRDANRNKNGKGGSRRRPKSFVMRWKWWRPSDTPTWGKLTPYTKEDPYFGHYVSWADTPNGKRSMPCNCEASELPLPCVPCHTAVEDSNTQLIPSRKDALTITVLENYHKVEQQGKKSKYNKLMVCGGVNRHNRSACEHCDNDLDTVYGNQFYWSLGYGHKLALEEQLDAIAGKCGSCKSGDVMTYGYGCTECKAVIASHRDDDIPEEDEDVLRTAEDICCPECDHVGKVEPLLECATFKGHGSSGRWEVGCENPTPIENVWDLEFLIRTVGKDNSTAVDVMDWRFPVKELKSWLKEPMDFPYFLSYMDLEEQAKMMGRRNPFAEDAQKALDEHFSIEREEEQTESY